MEIKLAPCCYERDKARSYYNHNYYKLKDYGDWLIINFDTTLYIYEECEEDENCYVSTLGYFSKSIDNKEKFVPIFSCTNSESCVK